MQTLLNIGIDGVAYGMVLFIIAVGLSVTLGLMRFVNLAHGAFAMIGGYAAALLTREAQWSFWLALPVAVIGTAAVGALLEALVLRHLYKRSELEQVLFTIGLAFFLIAATNALAGPQVQLITLPPVLTQSVDLGFRTLPAQRLLVIAAGLVVAAGAAWTMARTRFGIWLRAVVDHSDTASTLGIPIRTVQCASFAVGAALAGLGGVLGAELMPLEPYYALKYLVLVLVVVAVGGMGSIMGSLVAALSLGTVETASKYLASEWGSLFFFVAMAAMLAWRPQGILSTPRKCLRQSRPQGSGKVAKPHLLERR
ncbi:MAG: branched-chain amino acid ABC transporter permease [Bacteriovorax sp.]|nr:branched-chain amino acid ABC transporter permease [Rhizobacter sp.]